MIKNEFKNNSNFKLKIKPLFENVVFNVGLLCSNSEEEFDSSRWNNNTNNNPQHMITEYFNSLQIIQNIDQHFPFRKKNKSLGDGFNETQDRDNDNNNDDKNDNINSEMKETIENIENRSTVGKESPMSIHEKSLIIQWDSFKQANKLKDSDFSIIPSLNQEYSLGGYLYEKHCQKLLLQAISNLKNEMVNLNKSYRENLEYKSIAEQLQTINQSLTKQISEQQQLTTSYKQQIVLLNNHLLMLKNHFCEKENQMTSDLNALETLSEEQQMEIKNLLIASAQNEHEIFILESKRKSTSKSKTINKILQQKLDTMNDLVLIAEEHNKIHSQNEEIIAILNKKIDQKEEIIYSLLNEAKVEQKGEVFDAIYNTQILEFENEALENKLSVLTGVLEKQKILSLAKLEAVETKYKQVKIINELLQKEIIVLKSVQGEYEK